MTNKQEETKPGVAERANEALSGVAVSDDLSPVGPGGQFSLRLLGAIVTTWCVLLALAAPIWGTALPLLAVAALITLCMLGCGDWLSARKKLCRVMAIVSVLGILASFLMPVFPLLVTTGWRAFTSGLKAPGIVFFFW